MAKAIKTIEQLKAIDGKIYVRWSRSFAKDAKRGYSIRSGTSAEAGISCCEINKTWEDWRIIRQIQEYSFCGGSCWIITGDEVGRGADNEELLSNIELIGKVGDELTKADWKRMEALEDIEALKASIERVTDKFGLQILRESLAKKLAQIA